MSKYDPIIMLVNKKKKLLYLSKNWRKSIQYQIGEKRNYSTEDFIELPTNSLHLYS